MAKVSLRFRCTRFWGVLLYLCLAACGGDAKSVASAGNGDGGSTALHGQSGSASGTGGASGNTSGGSTASSGTSNDKGGVGAAGTRAGSGGAGIAGIRAGTGGGGAAGKPVSSDPSCAAVSCPMGKTCVLVPVTCIKAPCPSQPMCMDMTGSGSACDSTAAASCPAGQYCSLPVASGCGSTNSQGTCADKPGACTQDYAPVCGCDGTTYGNACGAASAGVSVDHQGECAKSALNDCDPRKVLCRVGPPKCAGGQVPSVSNGCYAGCVPVESCGCNEPAACPLPDEYTCHMSAGHCGPFV